MAQHLIKVFGERNTGTRAALTMLRGVPGVVVGGGYIPDPEEAKRAERLRDRIETQFRAPWKGLYLEAVRDMECVERGAIGAWKHSLPIYSPDFAKNRIHVLFMVRDPYSWALSLYRKPYHRKGPRADTVAGFLDQPWMTERRDYLPAVLESPMELWNAKLRAYLEFCRQANADGMRVKILRFEDFIADPVAQISGALAGFDVPARNVVPVENSTKNASQQLPALQEYYKSEAWRSRISREAAARIDDLTDWDVAAQFDYHKRSRSAFPARADPIDPQGVPKGTRVPLRGLPMLRATWKLRFKSWARSVARRQSHQPSD